MSILLWGLIRLLRAYRVGVRFREHKAMNFRVRLLGYLTNTLGRMISLYRYQGRNAEGLKSCRDTLTQMIQTI